MNPIVVNLKEGTKRVSVGFGDEEVCKVEMSRSMGRSSRLKQKGSIGTQILTDH